MKAVRSAIWFLIFQLIIILFVFVITGTFSASGQPLELVVDVAASIGTTVWAMGTGFFILGTFLNLALMFLAIARR